MNWLERARREINETVAQPTANTADGYPTAATAVLNPDRGELPAVSIGSNGSPSPAQLHDSEALREAFEERAAIMEHDGGLSREDAESAALALVSHRRRLH